MRIVAALGGNALLRRGEKPDAGIQLAHIRTAASALAPLANEHELILCHGNGPQVGLLALESEADASLSHPYPLDVLGAQTQGMIGYWLIQSLRNAGVTKPLVGVLTQTLVDARDPAFAHPTKFVGPVYTAHDAHQLANRHRWSIAPDGAKWRRVVPSPAPQTVLEEASIRHLLHEGTVVICGGGGGSPVVTDESGQLHGVEAVVDKDLTAALLAIALHADRLLILTDIPAVMRDFGTPRAIPLPELNLDDLAGMRFPAGSMGPKIHACEQFVTATGRPASIGALRDAAAVLAGTTGTVILPRQPSNTDSRSPHSTGQLTS